MVKPRFILIAVLLSVLVFSGITVVQAFDEKTSTNLIAGQTTDVGVVEISNNQTHLNITLKTTSNWMLQESHMSVVNSINFEDIPTTKKGNPIPGRFPYSNDTQSTIHKYLVDMEEANLNTTPGANLTIATHAEVKNIESRQKETAWGNGTEFKMEKMGKGKNQGNWGMHTNYTIQKEIDEELQPLQITDACVIFSDGQRLGTRYTVTNNNSQNIPYTWIVEQSGLTNLKETGSDTVVGNGQNTFVTDNSNKNNQTATIEANVTTQSPDDTRFDELKTIDSC